MVRPFGFSLLGIPVVSDKVRDKVKDEVGDKVDDKVPDSPRFGQDSCCNRPHINLFCGC